MGLELFEDGEWESAKAALEKALARDGENLMARFFLLNWIVVRLTVLA